MIFDSISDDYERMEMRIETITKMYDVAKLQILKCNLLIQTQEKYIQLLGEELDELCVLASVHGWKSKRVQQGQELRIRINELTVKSEDQ